MNSATYNVEAEGQVAQTPSGFAHEKGVGRPQSPTRLGWQFLGGTPGSAPTFPEISDGQFPSSAPTYFAEIRAILGVIDGIRRKISRQFREVDRRFRAALAGPSRFVIRVRSVFPDGSPSHAYLAVAFQSPARRGETWLRWCGGTTTRAQLYLLGARDHAPTVEWVIGELALLNRTMAAVNRSVLSVVTLLKDHASPALDEPSIPAAPPKLLAVLLPTFPGKTIDLAWALAVRIGRLDEALSALVEEYCRERPDPRILPVFSPTARFRWRILPGNRWVSSLTDRALRAVGIPQDRRRLLGEFERERRRLEARRRRLLGVVARLAARAREASHAFRPLAARTRRPALPCPPNPGSSRTA